MRTNLIKNVTAALALILSPSFAQACTGTVLLSADPGEGDLYKSTTKGDVIGQITHILIDQNKKTVQACSGDDCYLVMGLHEDGSPQVAMDISGCVIGKDSRPEGKFLRYEVIQKGADDGAAPNTPVDDIEKKKLSAATSLLFAMRSYPMPDNQFNNNGVSLRLSGEHSGTSITTHVGCKYEMKVKKGEDTETMLIDFSKLNGYRQWNNSRIVFSFVNDGQENIGYTIETTRKGMRGSGSIGFSPTLTFFATYANSIERITHNVDYMLKNGCGQSVIVDKRNPNDPY